MQAQDATADRCPRCGAGFHCGVADDRPCACSALKLDEPTLAALRQRYAGCLCLTCLAALSRDRPQAEAQRGR